MKIKTDRFSLIEKENEELRKEINILKIRIEEVYNFYDNHLRRLHNSKEMIGEEKK